MNKAEKVKLLQRRSNDENLKKFLERRQRKVHQNQPYQNDVKIQIKQKNRHARKKMRNSTEGSVEERESLEVVVFGYDLKNATDEDLYDQLCDLGCCDISYAYIERHRNHGQVFGVARFEAISDVNKAIWNLEQGKKTEEIHQISPRNDWRRWSIYVQNMPPRKDWQAFSEFAESCGCKADFVELVRRCCKSGKYFCTAFYPSETEMDRAVAKLNKKRYMGRKLDVLPNTLRAVQRKPCLEDDTDAGADADADVDVDDFDKSYEELEDTGLETDTLMLSVENLNDTITSADFENRIRETLEDDLSPHNDLSFARVEKFQGDVTGVLRFDTTALARKSQKTLESTFMNGRQIHLEPCHKHRSAFISKLPNNVSKGQVADYFNRGGLYVDQVDFLGKTRSNKNYCVVTFESVGDLNEAIATLNDSLFERSRISVKHCSDGSVGNEDDTFAKEKNKGGHKKQSSNITKVRKRKRRTDDNSLSASEESVRRKPSFKIEYQEFRVLLG